jgi:hypothetical protein
VETGCSIRPGYAILGYPGLSLSSSFFFSQDKAPKWIEIELQFSDWEFRDPELEAQRQERRDGVTNATLGNKSQSLTRTLIGIAEIERAAVVIYTLIGTDR